MASEDRPPRGDAGRAPEAGADEEVLVLPRSLLSREGLLPRGFVAAGWDRCLALVRTDGRFIARARAEDDPSLKQIIPYAVVTSGARVLLLRRTRKGSEARLHGKHSIGVGGHINREPVPPERLVEAGLRRELEEELSFERPYRHHPLGLINDDSVPVGRVHLGVVYRVEVDGEGARVREEELLEGRFAGVEELRPLLDSMETWSRLVAEALFPEPIQDAAREQR